MAKKTKLRHLRSISTIEKNGYRTVYPVFVVKNGSEEETLDVSLTGSSDNYKGMDEEQFIEYLGTGKFQKEYPNASVRCAILAQEKDDDEKRIDKSGYLVSYFYGQLDTLHTKITKDPKGNKVETRKDKNSEDNRVLREIKSRRGQPAFRKDLLTAFNSQCCVTGCKVEAILEAAHIISHSEEINYSVHNGLLLRADIHTLFDLDLIALDHFGRVHIHSKLRGTEYEAFDEKVVLYDISGELEENLKRRFERCCLR
ncbi:HNH endonuclease [Alteromonas sp. C1M14]|uniref:HNH endonuclease n=1 Tax=Alteromonas sp. C1M14 TaxID=2841567 RepID=UPI001C08567F|nr:HNH endonuclease [Alteromonas sp. C1M14]MBU2979709.1 HNH endonuclease [Alteromonas sp. C1M14]